MFHVKHLGWDAGAGGREKALRREGGGAGLGEGCRLSAPQTQNARGATARGGRLGARAARGAYAPASSWPSR